RPPAAAHKRPSTGRFDERWIVTRCRDRRALCHGTDEACCSPRGEASVSRVGARTSARRPEQKCELRPERRSHPRGSRRVSAGELGEEQALITELDESTLAFEWGPRETSGQARVSTGGDAYSRRPGLVIETVES